MFLTLICFQNESLRVNLVVVPTQNINLEVIENL